MGVLLSGPASAEWSAGTARIEITPQEPMWMAGYASRDHRAEGTLQPLWAKSLALQDTAGNRVVVITTDMLGFPKAIANHICTRLGASHQLERRQIVLNSSHTHSGPVLNDSLTDIYPLKEDDFPLIEKYSAWLEDRIVEVAAKSLDTMGPARVFSGRGICRFAVNRRNNNESAAFDLSALAGPTDHSVPVLRVERADGSPMTVLFGYACHGTVLCEYQWCGDYPGFAQAAVEEAYPGVNAMYFQGCGADSNALPRRTVAFAQQYGSELAAAVKRTMTDPMKELSPTIVCDFREVELELSPLPTREVIAARLATEKADYVRRAEQRWLDDIDAGKPLPTKHAYPVQLIRIGEQPLVALGGEVVADYSINLKQMLGPDLFVMGYSNYLISYIPSVRVLREGGYEGDTSQAVYHHAAKWQESIEARILNTARDLAAANGLTPAGERMAEPAPALDYRIDVTKPREEFDGTFCWFHPRVASVPGAGKDGNPLLVMTLQKHLLPQDDYYSGLYVMRSDDLGKTWTAPEERPELGWREEPGGITWAVCDVTPGWHPQTGKVLAIGHTVRYRDGKLLPDPRPRETAYAVHDPATGAWSTWNILQMPDPEKYFSSGAGCTQWLVEPDGSLLVPVYVEPKGNPCAMSTVLRCRFDGATLTYEASGDEITLDIPRGCCEPSLTKFGGKYFLTIRNDERGYVTSGDDGLHFAPIKPWTFDDGGELGSYNTQQHWVTHERGLFLAYTRRGANNDHMFRHRAPMFIAQVDPDKLCVVRNTERILIPDRGATLGNFGVCRVNENETWVTDAEGMFFPDVYKTRGATGAIFASRVIWNQPNR